MINQFRRKYPQGSLISELVSTKHGKYVVKVTVESEGKILSTALAGDYTVELAEDQARERALAILDLSIVAPESPLVNFSSPPPSSAVIPSFPLEDPPTIPPRVETPPTPSPVPESNDFVSDTIAEINLQMERLAWTREQGKDYLLKTYGKKSRHLLSDQELVEFLNYLKSQPS
ncbi:MAG: hypothetical protein EA365_15200 [Gloeocapsa sp. DLM2.Bin57]|nr:MAG: hypothetical protein EA365_15200 [Gloeocapsa sp. DLM2.Bin57]